ncbi:MarR family transcriptional regulator [Rheinheimera sp.]|jgi:DNA-binding MarR family transcriptional regulator|uniref:MarR family winged helix-turn-helix transcriptional regulator n=1 Tax=Rheinheimera sp. TaxID=1869214 RepID=UPI002615DEAC|nr:MarR family transcriptional regulator [Rheinheimera sp.]MCA1928672.1 MarR family transcriptional regulator [Rheinheimera sp.]
MEQTQDLLDQLQQLTAELRGQFFLQLGPELPGLTAMHGRLLLVIASQSGTTAQQLAELLRRDKAQMTRLLNDLQQAALVQRHTDPLDARRQLLVLSEQGQQIAAGLKAKKRQIANKMLHGLTTEQQRQMAGLLNLMYQNLVGSA